MVFIFGDIVSAILMLILHPSSLSTQWQCIADDFLLSPSKTEYKNKLYDSTAYSTWNNLHG